MKRFLLHASLFVLIVLLAASVADWVVTSGLRESRLDSYSEWNDIRDGKAAADILIQGSSRAWVQFSPAIIGGRVGMTCYNLGVDGYPVGMQLARYRLYREHNPKPRVIVQSVDLYGLVNRDGIFEPEQFLPYLNDPALQGELSQLHYFGWFDHDLPLVRYRAEWRTVYRGAMEALGLRSYAGTKVNGYQGQDLTWDPALLAAYMASHPNGVMQAHLPQIEAELDAFLGQCEREGVLVVLVFSPEYIRAQPLTTDRQEILDVYRRLADEHGFPFLDYSTDPICSDTKYFYNSQHMNRRGAELFSTEFARELAALLQARGIAPATGADAPGKTAAGGSG